MLVTKRVRAGLAAALLFVTVLMPVTPAFAATLNGHTVVLDSSGKIIPWTTNPGDGYGTVITSAWNYLLNSVPNDSTNGKPAYYSHSYMNPDTQQPVGWPHNPAGLYGMLTESALKYYAYSGDIRPVNLAKATASWQLAHGMTSSTDNWANVPYSSGESGSLNYQGASYGNSTGVGDGVGYLQPDKIGSMGNAWLQLYLFDGNTTYRDAAINAADTLASHVRTGNASQSPWPYRVRASDGSIREQYTANVIEPIQLFDDLIKAGLGNTAAYQSARTTAWNWLMTYPMQNNVWTQYFEDVAVQSDYTWNINQLVPMMTARYILQHPEMDPSWQSHVQGIITWVENNFGTTDSGANIIKEQNAFAYTMGSHTSRYASINALLSQATGNAAAKTKAYYSLNWSTYMARSNGVVIDGPQVNNQWFTDGYGDYIRHFLVAMQAFPEWAPSGQTHLTGSTSLVKNIVYTAGGVQYTTADAAATDSFRVNFTPATVTAGGVQLTQNGNLNQQGWTYDASTGVLRVRHDNSGSIQIVSGAPGNQPPTVSLTSPANGAGFTAGSTITLDATASDSDGTVSKVEFYNGSTLLNTDTSSPYSYSWTNVPAGSYTLTAVATDNSGAVTGSGGVSVNVTTPSTLPSPWVSGDVGTTGVAGSGSYNNGTFTVKGSGVDIWDAADSFQYVYQPLNGDGTITARVASIQNTDPWALAGVMIRESLAANSREAIAAVTPSNGVSFTWRSTTGASSSYTNGGSGTAPYWLRLQRSGNTITAFRSTNGTAWTQYATTTLSMGSSVYVGLAVTSHNNSVLATDTFDSVTVSGSTDTTAPAISGVASSNVNQNGASVAWTTNEASDSQVEYGTTTSYGLSTALNSSLVTNHTMVVSGLDASTTYHYRVKSRDAAGNLATSGDFTFVTPGPVDSTPPSTPTGLTAGTVTSASVPLSWQASSDDIAVTAYRIYRNGTPIGTSGTTSYTDTAVSQQTTYTYTVSALDAASNESSQSASVQATTPAFVDTVAPSVPGNVTATAVSGPQVQINWSASTDNVGVTGYQVWRDGAQLATTTSTNYTDTAVAAGESHVYSVRAADAANNVSAASAGANVQIPNGSATITIDKSVTTKQTTGSTTLTAPTFSTSAPNELLVAFVASDGPNNSITISGVTGGNLTWTLRKRVNTQRGTSEIWTAVAPTVTSNISVRATHTGSYQGMITVVAFQNAGVGTTGGANAGSGAASASLTTTANNAWVWGVGNDWDNATARTVGTNQTKVEEMLAPIGDTLWVQRQTAVTPNAGTVVTLNTTAPTNDRWNLATIEIIPQ